MGLFDGIVSTISGGGYADQAQGDIQNAINQYKNINLPSIEEQKISPEMLQYLADYAPISESTEQLGPSGYENVAVDPRLKSQQMDALAQLSGLSKSGLSPADLAMLEQTRRGAAAEAQAKSNQILQEMQQRGQGGSGAELIAKLKAAQGGADRQSAESLAIAKQAQERALSALSQGANLAGSVRGQEYGEQSDLAKARDIVNQFNTTNRQNVQQRNVGNQNQAQQLNLSNRQGISNANVGTRNQADQYNKQLLQQQFQNQMSKAGGIAGQYGNAAAAAQNQAANEGTMWGNIIGAGTKVAAAGA